VIIIGSATNIISLRVAPPPHIPLDSFWGSNVSLPRYKGAQTSTSAIYCTVQQTLHVHGSLYTLLAQELLWQPSFTAA
jgi:hypothetical protein